MTTYGYRVEGSVNVQSLEKSLKDLLSELRQTQTPLALESDTMDSLTSRPNAQAVNQRVLHHNSELTNFVSRLTEEKMELRNTLGRLEEEIWRYMQKGAEQQDAGQEVEESHQSGLPRDGGHSRPQTRLSTQLEQFLTTLHRHPVTPKRLRTLQQSRIIAPPFKCSSTSMQSVLFVFQLYSERPP
nr:uncharacterized protein LOC117683857 [Crassostrea gigas]XP_034309772.1 uncharacterized protein LOC117683857 [Crassostrea gigas]